MDHSVVDIRESSISCGVVGLSRISDEQLKNAYAVATHFYHPARGNPPAFVQWSNLASEETNGHRFANFVLDNKLGGVFVSETAVNPKTGNHICVWLWTVDHEAFKKWWHNERVERAKGK